LKTIQVLKGPAASALTVCAGQFGVILITTKKGSKNKQPMFSSAPLSLSKSGQFYAPGRIFTGRVQPQLPHHYHQRRSTKYVERQLGMKAGAPKVTAHRCGSNTAFIPPTPILAKHAFYTAPDNIKDFCVNAMTGTTVFLFRRRPEYGFPHLVQQHHITGIEPNTWLKGKKTTCHYGSLNITPSLLVLGQH